MATVRDKMTPPREGTSLKGAMYDIVFINSEGREDETEFSAETPKNWAECVGEIETLFEDFCRENGYDSNKVVGVEYVGHDTFSGE